MLGMITPKSWFTYGSLSRRTIVQVLLWISLAFLRQNLLTMQLQTRCIRTSKGGGDKRQKCVRETRVPDDAVAAKCDAELCFSAPVVTRPFWVRFSQTC